MPIWVQWGTFCIALLGAVLGVINTWRAVSRDRPKIRVRAVWYGSKQEGSAIMEIVSRRAAALDDFPEGIMGIEVVNVGAVAINIAEVGVCPAGRYWLQRFREFKQPKGRGAVINDADRKIKLPYKLEPGASMTVKFDGPTYHSPAIERAGLVYAYTSDERLFTGKSALLKALVNRARAVQ